jgi:hypothetical protein
MQIRLNKIALDASSKILISVDILYIFLLNPTGGFPLDVTF